MAVTYQQRRLAMLGGAVMCIFLLARFGSSLLSAPKEIVKMTVETPAVQNTGDKPAEVNSKTEKQDSEQTIGKIVNIPADSLTLSQAEQDKLWKDYKLKPFKSRGSTIFLDDSGDIRIPPDYILQRMELRDLEELYHLYLGTIQTLCKRKVHLGQIVDGGYDICLDQSVRPSNPCLMYSFGVRDDFSFDEEIVSTYGCEVHSFDPANGMKDHEHSKNVYFHSMGLGGSDGVINNNWKMRKFSSIKQELGHSSRKLEMLKIDMKGGEWAAIEQMLVTKSLGDVKQLIVRFHTWIKYKDYGFPDYQDFKGHLRVRKVELVKIDIEAGEWPAFEAMITDGMFKDVKQLITELHTWVDLPPDWVVYHRNVGDYRQHLNVLRAIYDEGFRIFFLRRFDAACCMFTDNFGIQRTGCNEVHFMKVD